MLSVWTVLSTLTVIPAVGQVPPADRGPPFDRSTLVGVYTAAQAAQGQDRYALMCQGCHTPASHTGPTFLSAWTGRALWELFGYLMVSMPNSEPGILTPDECAELVAYLLKLNGLPPGQARLPTDSVSLKAIRFDTEALQVKETDER